jgi:cell division protein ZapE
MKGPLAEYRRRVAAGDFSADVAQSRAVSALDRLHRDLLAAGPRRNGWRRRLARLAGRPAAPVRGVYLWGDVGRGKTCVLDLFYGQLPFADKLRLHFHRFMAAVHEDLKRFREHADPLELVAERLAERARIICFDELAVTDIADAMILSTLFGALFARGVALAATSNIEPRKLYEGGLQRQRFVPAIDLIERHTEIVHVGGETDYRLAFLEKADVYVVPCDDAATDRLDRYFRAMAGERGAAERGPAGEPGVAERGMPERGVPADRGAAGGRIEVLGRPIRYLGESDGVIWLDFAEICDGPRSQDDYIELSRLYHTVLVSNVPRFGSTLEDQARRFVALVDEFYDRRVKLLLSAAVPLDDLYAGARLKREFNRTRSRLFEMQSHDYLAAAHRP